MNASAITSRLRAKLNEELAGAISEAEDQQSFIELGVDSVIATELMSFIRQEFAPEASISILFDHPNLAALGTYLANLAGAIESGAPVRQEGPLHDGAKPIPLVIPTAIELAAPSSSSPRERRSGERIEERGISRKSASSPQPSPPGVAERGETNPGVFLNSMAVPLIPLPAPFKAIDAPARGEGRERGVSDSVPASSGPSLPGRREFQKTPIAVIGMAGRFPGAKNSAELWKNLAAGVCSITSIPSERSSFWDLDNLGGKNPSRCAVGGFLRDIDRFDAQFFGISPKEAAVMDPQQRLFLEEAWRAVEDAGYSIDALGRLRGGVYVGVMNTDYQDLLTRVNALRPEAHELMGNAGSILAARIAYHLNFRGPAMAIDTACSSSLVAVHLACRALQQGEIDLALAGGVTLYLTQKRYTLMDQAGMLSAAGVCRPFDDAADGFVPGEAAAVVVLKRLDDALAAGDCIDGVILSSGINQSGKTNGITAPSTQSQLELIQQVLSEAQVDPSTIDFLEAHGTGTRLGDPIEIEAVTKAFQDGARVNVRLGSLKANIGHTSAAAGIAGLIKVLLAMRHGAIPPQIHFEKGNHHARFSEGMRINSSLESWKAVEHGRRAAVSAFGFSGTNAHLIVEECLAERRGPGRLIQENAPAKFWIVLSARTGEALEQKANELKQWLETAADDAALGDLSFTLTVGRSSLDERLAFLAETLNEARAGLEQFLTGGEGAIRLWRGRAKPGAPAASAFGGAGEAWVAGAVVDWARYFEGGRRIHLPGYPFGGERHWFENDGPASNLLYEIEWEALETLAIAGEKEAGSWLVLADGGGMAERFADRLSRGGQPFHLLGGAELANPEKISAKLNEIAAADPPLKRVIDFRSLDLTDELSRSASGEVTATLARSVHFIQALARSKSNVSVHWITRGAQAVLPNDIVSPARAAVWGLGRAIAVEFPQLWGGMIDFEAGNVVEPGSLDRLVAEIVSSTDDNQIAMRAGRRYAPRLKPAAPTGLVAPLPVVANAAYLITGGLGALGLATAEWLSERGARHLILIGRRVPTEAVRDRIGRLEKDHSVQLWIRQVDLREDGQVSRLVAEMREKLPALRGVVHAAGVDSGRSAAELCQADFDDAFGAKAGGAILLHERLDREKLDFFVGLSSVASIWGSQGRPHYAAANAFLDGLMQHRHARGLAGTALNLGLVAESGMASREFQERLGKAGIRPLDFRKALGAMDRAQDRAQAIIADVDWQRFKSIYQVRRRSPFFSRVAIEAEPVSHYRTAGLLERLKFSPIGQQRTELRTRILELTGEVLKIDPQTLDSEAGFFELGMDSILAVQFRQRLEAVLGCRLPVTLAMDYPRVNALVDHLLDEFSSAPSATAPAVPAGRASDSAIAVIGLACRTPGARNATEFWNLLEEGREAIGEIPRERFDLDSWYDPDPEKPGKIYTRRAGLIDGIDEFDAGLFGIAPREARMMDPQQRIWLETAWEALEDAGLAADSLRGSRTGVYAGASAVEYGALLSGQGVEKIDTHFGTGNALNVIAGRLAFCLGLEGPALTIDTACSSSLVAIHQACQGLRSGDCDLAISGGISLLLGIDMMIATCRARMLSPDGRCKTFDAAANGFVRSEGCGVVVLKRLEEAVREGDCILAVIRGSAVNQDGASSGLTVPNGPAQERLIRQALRQAAIAPSEVVYLEAHGTGTRLGDPIEAQAAAAALGEGRTRPLLLGSAKTNVGHLEAAAGVIGLIKVILAMRHGSIPKHLHFTAPNPEIAWDRLPVKVNVERAAWPAGRKIAGVSSFGFSGTNAHVVVESFEKARPPAAEEAGPQRTAHVLPLSARTDAALRRLAARHAEWIERDPGISLGDVCHSAGVARSHLPFRAALVCRTAPEAQLQLLRFAKREPAEGIFIRPSPKKPKVFWLFSSSERFESVAAVELYRTEPVFRDAIDRCAAVFERENGSSLLPWFADGHTQGNSAAARFAFAMGLAMLWKQWAPLPDAVVGTGLGQYAAAVLAGVFTIETSASLFVRAFRSSRDAKLSKELNELKLALQRPELMILSASTGQRAHDILDAGLWIEQAQQKADPARVAEAMAESSSSLVIEVAVGSEFAGTILRHWPKGKELPEQFSVLDQAKPAAEALATALAKLYANGITPDFTAWNRAWSCRKISLPNYPFDRTRYWFEASAAAPVEARLSGILGKAQELASGEIIYSGEVSGGAQPWLVHHELYGLLTVPGTSYAAAILEATGLPGQLCDTAFYQPLLLGHADESHEIQLVLSRPKENGRRGFELHSRARGSNGWVKRVSGAIAAQQSALDQSVISIEKLKAELTPWPAEELFRGFEHVELRLGPAFRGIQSLWRSPQEALAELNIPEAVIERDSAALPAAVLDACLQVVGALFDYGPSGRDPVFFAPVHYERLTLSKPFPERFYSRAIASKGFGDSAEARTFEVEFLTTEGRIFGKIERFTLQQAPRESFLRGTRHSNGGTLHEHTWREIEQAPDTTGLVPARWLILEDDRGIGREVTSALQRRGHHCIVACHGRKFRRIEESRTRHGLLARYEIPLDEPGAWNGLFEEAGGVDGIVHLWGLDAVPVEACSTRALERDARLGCGALLGLAQALAKRNQRLPRGLWAVTSGAQAIGDVSLNAINQAPVWGLGRVLQLEHPEFRCHLVDMDERFTAETCEDLVNELEAPTDRVQLAIRGGRRYAPAFSNKSSAERRTISLPPTGSYLITGGLGGLGLELARWLAQRGAKQIVLNGRSEPNAAARAVIRELEERGVEMQVVRADISQELELRQLLEALDRTGRPLRGIFHLAGVIRDGALAAQSWSAWQEVFAPKVFGAWNLHALTASLPLDYFVLFSSVAAALGNPGQANYAAANAYLDALAQHRRAIGLPAVSINWGPWLEAGMAAGKAADSRKTGLRAFTIAEGLQALETILSGNPSPTIGAFSVVPGGSLAMDGETFGQTTKPLASNSAGGGAAAGKQSTLIDQLRQASEAEQLPLLVEFVGAQFQAVLRTPAPPEPSLDFSEYGMDSLMALELRNRLQREVEGQLSLPYALAFQNSTTQALAKYICDELRDQLRAPTVVVIESQPAERPLASESSERLDRAVQAQAGPPAARAARNGRAEGPHLNGESRAGSTRGKQQPFPLSDAQRGLWAMQQWNPSSTAYHLPLAVQWNERIEIGTLRRVLEGLASEQPALRTRFHLELNEPVQSVDDAPNIELSEETLEIFAREELLERIRSSTARPFDLERGPLWRVGVFQLPEGRSVLLLNFHHLIFDGRSCGLILEEIASRYKAFGERRGAPPRATVADYVEIERAYFSSPEFRRDEAYWAGQFPNGIPAVLPGSERPDAVSECCYREIPAELIEKIEGIAAAERVTVQAIFLAAFSLLLSGGREKEMTVGVAMDVRPDTFDRTLGYFVNLVPIRTSVSGRGSFRALLREVFEHLVEALEHRRFPFRQLARMIAERSGDGAPRNLEAALYFQTWESAGQRALMERVFPDVHQTGELDLVMEVIETAGDWRLCVRARRAIEGGLASMAEQFRSLLETVASGSNEPLNQLLVPARSERNGSKRFQYPNCAAHELIEAQARKSPEAIAVIFQDQQLTYAELDERANQLANHLIATGIEGRSLVGVLMDRSIEMVVTLLAVWKAGLAYVPLDRTYPAARLEHIMRDAKLAWLLADAPSGLAVEGVREIELNRSWRAIAEQSSAAPGSCGKAAELAYVIYTSGSTGQPKGVQIAHRSLTHFLCCMAERPGCAANDRILALTTICFDIAALEIFLPLIRGASVEIVSSEIAKDGVRLKRKIEQSGATIVQATPATWRMLLAAELGPIPRIKVLCGGEAWDGDLAEPLLARAREVWNMYGPTETTIWSSVQKVQSGQEVELGDPIGNTEFYVFDDAMKPVALGEVGELFIGGDGLARGYLNRPELTRERFVPNPLRPEELIYRTGDLVRYGSLHKY